MERDRALAIFLMVLFAVAGAVTLILSWIRPMPESERVIATLIGSAGLIWALARMFRHKSAGKSNQTVPAEAEIQARNKI
ncbi:MAG: hypothetical protein ABH839_04340 [Chloroflexota bacterium]